jgi:hypothetical protein
LMRGRVAFKPLFLSSSALFMGRLSRGGRQCRQAEVHTARMHE